MDRHHGHYLSAAFLLLAVAAVVATSWRLSPAPVAASSRQVSPFSYLVPRPEAKLVSPETSLAVRARHLPGARLMEQLHFEVEGTHTGKHDGRTVLARDGETVLFYPESSFERGETVEVVLTLAPAVFAGNGSTRFAYNFTVSSSDPASLSFQSGRQQSPAFSRPAMHGQQSRSAAAQPARYLTAPGDLPTFEIARGDGTPGTGYLFLAYFDYYQSNRTPGYHLIVDNNGEVIYYNPLYPIPFNMDFKKQPNGWLTYYSPFPRPARFYALDKHYQPVHTYQAGNGYIVDRHDLQALANGHALVLIYDHQMIDMSQIVPGGKPQAVVTGCIVQEIDLDGNVLFEWRSWDHIDIRDTNRPLTMREVDYIHCNAVEQDHDGHLLLTSRHLDEITKIDRQTGEIIWRFGGKQSDFVFTNDDGFNYPHDGRRLSNGHVTVYDNGPAHQPAYSRGVEYVLDTVAMTATRVAEFRKNPDVFAVAMGNMQRLPEGNTVVGWGRLSDPVVTEFDAQGRVALELAAPVGTGSYRVLRFPWNGQPDWPPVLVAAVDGETVALHFSWNGSTETAAYRVWGGQEANRLQLLAHVQRSGFETTFSYEAPFSGLWYFQVEPVDKQGQRGHSSNLAPVVIGGWSLYAPLLIAPAPSTPST